MKDFDKDQPPADWQDVLINWSCGIAAVFVILILMGVLE